MITTNLRELHSEYMLLMDDFHEFCVKNNLRYYMVGGTLLGAIREKGFIPWDDDVDFAMPRPDYERFISEYRGSFKLYNYKKTKGFQFVYTKLFDGENPIVYLKDDVFKIEKEVFVKLDVYPIDGLGNDFNKALKNVNKVNMYKEIIYKRLSNDNSRNILKKIALWLVRIIPLKILFLIVERNMKKYSYYDSNFVTRWRQSKTSKNIVKRDIFGTPILYNFENIVLYGPENADSYLESVYGDYKTAVRENTDARHAVDFNRITKNLKKMVTKRK